MCNLQETKSATFEFEGIPSGDFESFCWDVDKATYTRIKGEIPGNFDKSMFNKDMYRIYPSDFYGLDNSKCRMKINIEVISK